MKKLSFCFLLFVFCSIASAQIKNYQPGHILHDLEKLKVLGSVMYIAAHPDDENTMLITWLANEKKVRTAYFSFTRGDGGQNLIGTEQDEYVGLLRTHELLGARSIDGGEQYFSRANDFGYSKTTEEALKFWNKDLVLGDLVYRIRKFRPDVMITRFPPDERAGHGHHSASSLLAEIAFDAAGNPAMFPEQLKDVSVWQPKRLLWNSFNPGFTAGTPQDGGFYLKYDIEGFNTLLGESYGELGGKARSMHKSQGFGSLLSRGEQTELLRFTKGDKPENDLFDGVNLTWTKVKGGEQIQSMVDEVIRNFKPADPSASAPALNQILSRMETLQNDPWVVQKKKELTNIILRVSGIYLEINAQEYAYSPGDSATVVLNLLNRGTSDVQLNRIEISEINLNNASQTNLPTNKPVRQRYSFKLPDNFPITQPYWLMQARTAGSYILDDETFRNEPVSPPALSGKITLTVDGKEFSITLPVNYKYADPAKGEIYRYLEVRPSVMVTANKESMLFTNAEKQELLIAVKAGKGGVKGKVRPKAPSGWKITPETQEFDIAAKHSEQILRFDISPLQSSSTGILQIEAEYENRSYNRGINVVKYDHVPEITTFPSTQLKLLKPEIVTKGKQIGYIMGAGDKLPEALTQMGYDVSLIDETNINQDLSRFDAIIIGVRAYNTKEWLPDYSEKLNQYVFKGGNLICQYQTASRSGGFQKNVAPYSLQIGRDRVSEEDAAVKFLNPEHALLNYPNKITQKDFEGWVQERGLYFAEQWASEFTPILAMHDTGETPKNGSLLYAKYGSGNYIFTALSFFRELPAGVPGAYRLLANLIAAQ
jgi:LmbE family N-acetylglucosaminyl deacetylase